MSTTTTPVLTDKQRAWANAFLRAMGGSGSVEAQSAPPPQKTPPVKVTGKTKTTTAPKSELGEKLEELDQEVGKELRAGRDQLAGKGEIDISRKKLIGRSLDKGFKTGVVSAVDQLMAEVDRQLASGGRVDERALGELRAKLVTEQKDYRDGIQGEKNRAKREQRQKKVDAIQTRIDGLDKLVSASGRQDKAREDAVTQMSVEDRAKMLSANPEMLKALVAAKPAPKEIADVLSAISPTDPACDALVEALVAAHGTDIGYMETICDRVVGNELGGDFSEAKVKTFMRQNSAATKLTKVYAQTGETATLLDDIAGKTKVWLQPSRKIEIDPARQKDPGEQQKALDSLIHYISRLLGDLIGSELPRQVVTTASMIAEGARKVGANVPVMVGGHIFLRIINPMLVKIPGLDADQRRAMVLATKALQNASNGLSVPEDGKEPFMRLFADTIDEYLPDLQKWFLQIARQGDELRGVADLDEEVGMGGTTRRDSLLLGLDDPGLKLADYFAVPSKTDVLGVKPLHPDTRIGALILTAGAAKPQSKGLTLPANELQKQSHARLVERERRAVIAKVIERLKAEKPKGREDD